ncbi:MAG: acyl-CoA thioesterase [Deltaproteobacteria bacterium]|nr:acyl-CoA thioesterase [Deltaproteobacteria bacterium]
MENFKLVLPEHLNHYGFLFGGNMLKWVDEAAYIAVRIDYPAADFVTIAFNEVEFRRRVEQGSVLRFVVNRSRVGNSSVDYRIKVYNNGVVGEAIFSTVVTMVCVDREGRKRKLPEDG